MPTRSDGTATRPFSFRWLIAILILSAAGCAPRAPKPPPVTPGGEGGETIKRFLGDAACPADLASDLEFEIEPPNRPAVRLVGSLRASWPDKMRLQLRFGPFTPVASIAVGGDSAFISFPKAKAYWAGRPSEEEAASPAALASGLLSLICPAPLVRALEEPVLDQDRKGWILQGRLGHGSPAVLASLRLAKGGTGIEEITLTDSLGAVLLRAERSGRIRIGQSVVSERVRITTGNPPTSFAARLMRARGDPGQPPGLFRIPPPAGVRRLQGRELFDLLYTGGGRP